MNRLNQKYAIGRITYRSWQSIIVVVLGLSLMLDHLGNVAFFAGVFILFANIAVVWNSRKVPPDSVKLKENRHSEP